MKVLLLESVKRERDVEGRIIFCFPLVSNLSFMHDFIRAVN